MAKSWTLAAIREEFRDIVRDAFGAIGYDRTDAQITDLVNEYYQNIFPTEANVSNFDSDFTQDTSVDDDGQYSLAQTVIQLEEPMTINGEAIVFYREKDRFFAAYPDGNQYISPPSLAIGSSSLSAVANSAFTYAIENYSYSAAAAETELSGDDVPQSTYGAWSLTIDSDGTITVNEAADNATGYATPGLAVAGLSKETSDSAFMGYITAIDTSAAFTPGTTELSASGVTATYTDGLASDRDRPEAALVHDNILYLRPKPNDIFRFKCSLLSRPTALSSDTSTPSDIRWGPVLALGAAILFIGPRVPRDAKAAKRQEAVIGRWEGMIRAYLLSINKKSIFQMTGRPARRSF